MVLFGSLGLTETSCLNVQPHVPDGLSIRAMETMNRFEYQKAVFRTGKWMNEEIPQAVI